MPHVSLPPLLAAYLGPEGSEVEARTFGELKRRLFDAHPTLRRHLVHEDGGLRTHLVVAVNDRIVREVDDDFALGADDRVDVLQAVSGG